MSQKKKWAEKHPKERAFTVITRALLIVVGITLFGSVVGAMQSGTTPEANTAPAQQQSTPVVTHKTDITTNSIPYSSVTKEDPTVPSGTSTVTTAGVEGLETKTYDVTLTNGSETSRTLIRDETTKAPVSQVTTIGTYVAPSCTNGTYVNSAGNTVCSPEYTSSAPSGATAQCGDGSYSFSQSRRGTCSHHGGVASWL